jgi:hypothetical protein
MRPPEIRVNWPRIVIVPVIELTGRISKGVLMTVLLACWAWLSAAANSGDAIRTGAFVIMRDACHCSSFLIAALKTDSVGGPTSAIVGS